MLKILNGKVAVENSDRKANVPILTYLVWSCDARLECLVRLLVRLFVYCRWLEVTECTSLRPCLAENSAQPDEEAVHAGRFEAPYFTNCKTFSDGQ